MNVENWSRSLAELTGRGGWIGVVDGVADAASEALKTLAAGGWIDHRFKAEVDSQGRARKPEAAHRASRIRGAALRLAAAHGLLYRAARGASELDALVQAVVHSAMVAPTGLRARSIEGAGNRPYQYIDFARSPAAVVFFDTVIRSNLARLDKQFGTRLAPLGAEPYEHSSARSVEHWGRLWTLSAALAPLSWARARGCLDARDVARAFWRGHDPVGRPLPQFYVRGGPLPTGNQGLDGGGRLQVHAELKMRPSLAQLLEGRDQWQQLPPDATCAIHVPLKEIDYVARMIDGTQQALYRGRGVFQIYLAVLADCLLESRPDRDAAPVAALPAPTQVSDGESQAVAPAHAAIMRELRASTRSHPGRQRQPAGPSRRAAPIPGALRESGLVRLPALHVSSQIDSPGPQRRWIVVGTIDTWPSLSDDIEGIEWICVAHEGDQQYVLPICVEQTGEVHGGSDRGLQQLVIDSSATSNGPDLQWVRQSICRHGTVSATYTTAGAWAFGVLEFHG